MHVCLCVCVRVCPYAMWKYLHIQLQIFVEWIPDFRYFNNSFHLVGWLIVKQQFILAGFHPVLNVLYVVLNGFQSFASIWYRIGGGGDSNVIRGITLNRLE